MMKTLEIDEGSLLKHHRPSKLHNPQSVGFWIHFNSVRIRRRLVRGTLPIPPQRKEKKGERKHDKTSKRPKRRGPEQAGGCFPLMFALSLTARGTNVSVCSWGCSATFGRCFLKRTTGVNEVQRPLCKSRLRTRHRRYGDASVLVYGRARASASLCCGD